MKDKIIMLLIGIVIGAVLSGACFWFATSLNSPGGRGNMPEMEDRGEMREQPEFNSNNTTTE